MNKKGGGRGSPIFPKVLFKLSDAPLNLNLEQSVKESKWMLVSFQSFLDDKEMPDTTAYMLYAPAKYQTDLSIMLTLHW